MASSGMLRRVALVRSDVSEELIASIIRVTRSVRRLLVTANVVPSLVALEFGTVPVCALESCNIECVTRYLYHLTR
jgi:hypothetical protein